ncbi:MAG: transglutaminase-like domain-containing protein [Spirochaetales bacterium]
MELKKVQTDNYYKQEYIYCDGSIFELSAFYLEYPDVKKKAEKILNNSSKDVINIIYKPFPNEEQIILDIESKRSKIYEGLNLNKQNSNKINAILLYDYLAKNITYDMTSLEETKVSYESRNKVKEEIHKLFQNSGELYSEVENGKKSEDDFLSDIEKHFKNSIEARAKMAKLENGAHLKNLYNVLINKKGVCNEFSYAYQFLLAGLGIESYVVSILKPGDEEAHTFVVVPYMLKGKEYYFVADLTIDTVFAKNKGLSIYGFGFSMAEYFAENNVVGEVVEVLKLEGITPDTRKPYLKNIYTKSLKKELNSGLPKKQIFEEDFEVAKRLVKDLRHQKDTRELN